MWFKLYFFLDRHGILAAVAADGKVYFKAADLGKFLGYSNPYSFAKNHGTKDLRKIVPWNLLRPRDHGKVGNGYNRTTMVLDFEEMIDTIRKTFAWQHFRCDENKIDQLTYLWNYGIISKYDNGGNFLNPNPICYINSSRALSLFPRVGSLDNNDGCIRLQDWIREFSVLVLKMFHDLNTISLCHEKNLSVDKQQQQQTNCLEMSSSDETTNYIYDTPPPSVNNKTCSQTHLEPKDLNPPIFNLEYDGFENLPDEICIIVCGVKNIYSKKKIIN